MNEQNIHLRVLPIIIAWGVIVTDVICGELETGIQFLPLGEGTEGHTP
jgi:hypothetical protein